MKVLVPMTSPVAVSIAFSVMLCTSPAARKLEVSNGGMCRLAMTSPGGAFGSMNRFCGEYSEVQFSSLSIWNDSDSLWLPSLATVNGIDSGVPGVPAKVALWTKMRLCSAPTEMVTADRPTSAPPFERMTWKPCASSALASADTTTWTRTGPTERGPTLSELPSSSETCRSGVAEDKARSKV